MMNDMVVCEAVKGISTTVNTFLTNYRNTKLINKAEQRYIVNQVSQLLALQRSHAVAEIFCVQAVQIQKYLEKIDTLHGAERDMMVQNLARMNECFEEIRQDYMRSTSSGFSLYK